MFKHDLGVITPMTLETILQTIWREIVHVWKDANIDGSCSETPHDK